MHQKTFNIQLSLDLVRVGDGLITDLVQGVRGIGDQLSQEDLLVGVERIDNPEGGIDERCLNLTRVRGTGSGLLDPAAMAAALRKTSKAGDQSPGR